MTDDLVKRLRECRVGCGLHCSAYDAREPLDECIEAASRIEKLEAALREIIGALNDPKVGQYVYDMFNASYIARKALEGKDD